MPEICCIWLVFLPAASKNSTRQRLFIEFTIVANLVHVTDGGPGPKRPHTARRSPYYDVAIWLLLSMALAIIRRPVRADLRAPDR